MDPNFHVSSATFSHLFENFSQINKLSSSPACWIQNLPWKIFIEPIIQKGIKYLSVYVGCTESVTDHWSCRAVVELYKLNGETPKIIRANTSLTFDSAASTSWGHVQFMHWDVVLDPAKGFIRDNAITIEVTINAEIPVGLNNAPEHYTDERANLASREWLQAKQILRTKIEELINSNQEKQNKLTSLLQDIQLLKKELEMKNEIIQQIDECKKSLENEQNQLKVLQDTKNECEANLNIQKETVVQLRQNIIEKDALVNSYTAELETAEDKLKEVIDLKIEKQKVEDHLASVTKQLEDCRSMSVHSDNNDSNNLCDDKVNVIRIKNTDLTNRLSSTESELYREETKKHKKQIEDMKQENDYLIKKLDAISKELELAKQKMNSSQTNSSQDLDESNQEKQKLISDLQNLQSQMKNSNIENNNLRIEKGKLRGQLSTLQMKFDEISNTLNSVTAKIKQNEDEINRLKTDNQNLIARIKTGDEKYNILKNQKDSVDSQLKILSANSTKDKEEADNLRRVNTAKLQELSVCNEALQSMRTQNKSLTSKLLSSNTELEEMKNKFTPLEDNSKLLSKICDNLKLEIDTLNKSLSECRQDNQKMKNKFQKRTTQNENTNFEVDLINENMTTQGQNMTNSKLINGVDTEKLTDLEEKYKISIYAKTKLECEVEILRKKFEKINKDTLQTYQEQSRNITNKLNDLQSKLDEERNDKLRILNEKKEADDQVNQLKQENEVQIKTKNNLLSQIRECHRLSKEVFWIIIELVKIKKSQEDMPCSLEARLKVIMEILNKNKRRAYLRSTSTDVLYNQPPSIQISTEVIEKKLNNLEARLEKEIELVTQELKSEQINRKKLILSITKLSALLENETFMSNQYKKLVEVSESRSEGIQNKLHDFNNQLFNERNRRFHYEEEIQRLLKRVTNMELQTNQLKKKEWKQALEVIDAPPNTCSEDHANDLNENEALVASISADIKGSIASCDSETNTNKNATKVNNISSKLTPDTNEVIAKQAEEKIDESGRGTQAATISESNSISVNNAAKV